MIKNLSLFCATILLITVSSCRKENLTEVFKVEDPPGQLIQDSKHFFENSVLGQLESPGLSALKDKNKKQSLIKNPLWKEAKIRKISIGDAVIVPLYYNGTAFTKVGRNTLSLNNISYLMMYKSKGQMKTEVVTWYPDEDYWEDKNRAKKPFAGTIIVEDWQGNFIKGYHFYPDGRIEKLVSSSSQAQTDGVSMLRAELNCYTIITWSSVEVGGITYYTYYSNTYCSESGGGGFPNPPGDGGSGNSGGGDGEPTPGDYTPPPTIKPCGPPPSDTNGSTILRADPDCDELPPDLEPDNPLVKSFCNGLTPSQISTINNTLDKLKSYDCGSKFISNLFTQINRSFEFCIDGTIGSVAAYDSKDKTFKFMDDEMASREAVAEHELFHAFQDYIYPNGTSQYGTGKGGPKPGNVNLEFERALMEDILHGTDGAFFYHGTQDQRDAYKAWINEFTIGGTYPKLNPNGTSAELAAYNAFINKYNDFLAIYNALPNNPYSGPALNLPPLALINLFNNINPNCE